MIAMENPARASLEIPPISTEAAGAAGAAGSRLETCERLLRCPKCRGHLQSHDDRLTCVNESCRENFPLVDGVPVLINEESSVFQRADFVTGRKTTFDLRRNRLVRRVDTLLPVLGRNHKARENYRTFARLLLQQSSRPVVLVIGGSILGEGLDELARDPRVQLVESDVSFGPRTQVIGDAHDLPFGDQSFDGVIVQAVLQYVANPARCLQEIERVLKQRGLVYAETAFMQQVVHGRYDFTRFTHLGLLRLFRGFEEIGSGPVGGPGMSLAWSCQFLLLSLTTSRWARRLLHVFGRLTLFWLKYLDAGLMNKPGTYDAASGFYFMGRKSNRIVPDRELIAHYRGAQ